MCSCPQQSVWKPIKPCVKTKITSTIFRSITQFHCLIWLTGGDIIRCYMPVLNHLSKCIVIKCKFCLIISFIIILEKGLLVQAECVRCPWPLLSFSLLLIWLFIFFTEMAFVETNKGWRETKFKLLSLTTQLSKMSRFFLPIVILCFNQNW